MCCDLNWNTGWNKTSEILRAQKEYSKNELQQTNGQRTYIVLGKTSDRKRDTPDRKLKLIALEETTLK